MANWMKILTDDIEDRELVKEMLSGEPVESIDEIDQQEIDWLCLKYMNLSRKDHDRRPKFN